MNESFKWLLVATFGVWTLVLFAFLIYLSWAYLELKKDQSQPPQVARDHTGRPLKERV
jgi:hypothetical protein